MSFRATSAALAALILTSITALSAVAQDAAQPPKEEAAPAVMKPVLTILCDEGKTRIEQRNFVSQGGGKSAVVAITTPLGNLYTVNIVGGNAVTSTLKPAGDETIEMDHPTWLKHVREESTNYALHTRRQPNDCRIVDRK